MAAEQVVVLELRHDHEFVVGVTPRALEEPPQLLQTRSPPAAGPPAPRC